MIPETANRKDWPRLVKLAFVSLKGGADSTAAALAALDTRVDALETAGTFRFTPMATPSSPVEGLTYMDSTTHKLRTYDGTAWQDHW